MSTSLLKQYYISGQIGTAVYTTISENVKAVWVVILCLKLLHFRTGWQFELFRYITPIIRKCKIVWVLYHYQKVVTFGDRMVLPYTTMTGNVMTGLFFILLSTDHHEHFRIGWYC